MTCYLQTCGLAALCYNDNQHCDKISPGGAKKMKTNSRDSVYLLDFFPATRASIACQLNDTPSKYKATAPRHSHLEHFTQCEEGDEPVRHFTQCDAPTGMHFTQCDVDLP